jgi:hypothetical protein
MCTNDDQISMAQIIATAMLIEKLEASKTAIPGSFGEGVDIVLEQLRNMPLEPDGTRNIANLAEYIGEVH